ncbi:MAG TPA: hypothetical protein VKT77_10100 [Chthonomonadaceae bacterium]|nr:hypothetical protein [Chthonomonadaceae bacterium]
MPISDDAAKLNNAIDVSVKALFRECPAAALRLAGLNVAAEDIRVEDANINLPELRADHVFIIPASALGDAERFPEDEPEIGVYLEYQLVPDLTVVRSWFAKCAGLTRQIGAPIVLLVIYLERRDRATFPDRYTVSAGSLVTEFRFTAIRLWEYADRIRSGELAELAPLLVLCEDKPTPATIREEVDVLHRAGLPVGIETDLLGLALRIASRRLPREIIEKLFAEDLAMLREASIIDEWIADGEQRGRMEHARAALKKLGAKRFGEPDARVLAAIDAITDQETLDRLLLRVLDVESWSELLALPA